MAAAKRIWFRWVAIAAAVVVFAAVLWWVETSRGLSSVFSQLQALVFGEESAETAADETAADGMQEMPGMMENGGREAMEPANGVPGYAPVVIDPALQQRIGVTTAQVVVEPLRMSVKTVGIIRPDETRTARIHLRTQGWVEELFVDYTGQRVKQGDPLLSIYSPEFLQAQEEFLVARESDSLGRLGGGGQSLAQTALQKLRLWDVPEEELRELQRTGQPKEKMVLRTPLGGTVLEKNVLKGEYVTPDRELYVTSDLSVVWVQAKVYQYELPHIEIGKRATVTVAGIPEALFEGQVVFIQPSVDPVTRTVQVRIELQNAQRLLKPDMFVEVEIEHPMGEGLLVPVSAVFRTGKRDILFRAESSTRFTPVEVDISPMKFANDRYHVLAGLEVGDRIITSANFLIDSESRLRFGGGAMMPGMDMDMPGMEDMDHSQMKHSTPGRNSLNDNRRPGEVHGP